MWLGAVLYLENSYQMMRLWEKKPNVLSNVG